MLDHFEKIFRPTARKQPGYIDLKTLKLQQAVRGAPPPGCKFRFVLTFVSEEMRQKWIASAAHAQVWPKIEDTKEEHLEMCVTAFDKLAEKAMGFVMREA